MKPLSYEQRFQTLCQGMAKFCQGVAKFWQSLAEHAKSTPETALRRMGKSRQAWPVLLLIAGIAGNTACTDKPKTGTTENTGIEQTDTTATPTPASATTENADQPFSVRNFKSKISSDGISVTVEMDYPVSGNEALTAGIRKAIGQILKIETTARPEQPQDIVDKAAQVLSKELAKMRNEADMEDYPDRPDYEESREIKLSHQTDKFVTFLSKGYSYCGGAHGMSSATYLTFDAQTGKQLTWNDLFAPSVRKRLSGIVRQAIVEQFYDGDGSSLDVLSPFALPEQVPNLTEKGVSFQYSLYEIDCYAAGMPGCVIPYADIRSLMTEYAQSLIP